MFLLTGVGSVEAYRELKALFYGIFVGLSISYWHHVSRRLASR